MDSSAMQSRTIQTINNNGTDSVRGFSNQCMLISILDYLRYINPEFTNNPDFILQK